ncbi:MAG: TrgA family protein [Pelagimonas sp.]|jgi:hypothetical protein|nr:TrgA family protein [Pelagimonas sp.]
MPTAAKLFAAFGLAVTGFFVSEMIKLNMPEGTQFGFFSGVNVLIGSLIGWFVVGPRSGRGVTPALNNGITSVLAFAFWALFVQACNEMLGRSMDNAYDNFTDAIVAIFEIMLEFGEHLMDLNILMAFFFGGILSGLAAEVVSRYWR